MPRAVSVNLATVLAFAAFWIGGVQSFGAGAREIIVLPALVLLTGAAGWFFRDPRATQRFDLTHLHRLDLAFMLAFVAAMLAITWPRLTQDLWSDGLYNASLATRHAQLAVFHIRDHMPGVWRAVAGMDARTVVWMLQAATLGGAGLVFLVAPALLQRWPLALAAFWIVALLAVRFLTSADHGLFAHDVTPVLQGMHPEQDPHPTLRLAPLWFTSAIFGPHPYAYRLAGFGALLLVSLALYAGLRRTRDVWTAALTVTALATVPVLWHTAYLVEASIWPALAGIGVFALLANPAGGAASVIAPALMTALACWMRAPAFLLLVPFAALLAAQLAATKPPSGETAFAVLCIVLGALGAANALLGGSPAVSDAPPLQQVVTALSTQTPWIALAATAGLLPFLFVGSALRADTTRGALFAAGLLAFLLLSVAVFYGPTRASLWGVSRYQAEFGAPVIAAGLVAFAYATANARHDLRGATIAHPLMRLLPAAPLLAVIAANLFSLATFDSNTRKTFPHALPGQTVKSEAEYPITTAFQLAQTHGGMAHVYYVGIWYGGFQGVLQGMNTADYAAFSALNERNRAGWNVNIGGVIADPDVASVIVEEDASFDVFGPLDAAGWRYSTITHPRSGLKLRLYARP